MIGTAIGRIFLPELTLLDQVAAPEPIDLVAVRGHRLRRVREQMAAHGLDACLLVDPVNIRYATGARETIDEIRPTITASYVAAGDAIEHVEKAWAGQVGALLREHCGPRAAVGVERVNAGAPWRFANRASGCPTRRPRSSAPGRSSRKRS